MKKIIVLFTVLALVLSLFAGCGSKEDEAISGKVEAPSAEPAPVETLEPDSLAEPEEMYDSGIVIGGTYTNEFIGINCTLDSSWIFFDEAQMAELNGFSIDSISDEALREKMENSGTTYDMYAMSIDGSGTMNIIFEDLGIVYGSILSEEGYAEIALKQLPSALEAAGMTDVVCEISNIEFCGENHAAINVSAIIEGSDIYETLVCMKAGKYMACITFCTIGENRISELMDFFYTGEPRPAESESVQQPDIDVSADEIETGEFSIGKIDGYTYINEFLGIRCDLDDYWTYSDEATLAAYNGLSSSTYTTDDALTLFEQGVTPYDMEAWSTDGYYSMNIVFEKLADVYGATLSPEDYLDISISQLAPVLEQAGYTDVVCEKTAMDFCGETRAAAKVSATLEGFAIYESVIVLKAGNYVACITLCCIDEDACDLLAGFFSKLD